MKTKEKAIPHPRIVSRDEWIVERKKLLEREKELTRHGDRVNAERRRLPMVKIEKEYVFDGPEGKRSLGELFDGRRQLIVYHFMFDPEWDKGCSRCTRFDGLNRPSSGNQNHKETQMLTIFIEAPTGIRGDAKKRLMEKTTAALDEAYHIIAQEAEIELSR